MNRFGAQDQAEWLRTVLSELLCLHFPYLSVRHIVPTSFAREEYEVEIVNSWRNRAAWLAVTQKELDTARANNSRELIESLKTFVKKVGLQ